MTILQLHTEPLRDAWLDAYGHLNEAYYLVPFTNTTWKLQDRFGIGVDYFERTGGALYTVESHMRYVKEVRAPALIEVASMIFGADPKRIRFAHVMTVDGIERATFECLLLHYDTRAGRVAPMADDVVAALRAAAIDPLPEWAGRRVSLARE